MPYQGSATPARTCVLPSGWILQSGAWTIGTQCVSSEAGAMMGQAEGESRSPWKKGSTR